jgi:hypothetical protein
MLRLAAAALALLLVAPAAAADVNGARARAAEAALERAFAAPASGLYLERSGGRDVAYVWPFSQALAASVAVARLPDATPAERRAARVRLAALEHYRLGPVYRSRPGGDVFVDDNQWIAFDLLDGRALLRDPHVLARARTLFAFAVEEWDDNPSHPCPGGVYWSQRRPNRDRAAVSTAGAALLGARLASLPGADPAYAWWSRRMLDWLDRCLLLPSGLYANAVALDGSVNGRAWSYNQGLAIGALVLAARAGDPTALARAEQVANASLWFLDPAELRAEPPEFDAVLARNLLLLGRLDGDPRWYAAVQSYADAAWTLERDPRSGLFLFGAKRPRLLAQAALVQIYALLAGSAVTDDR